MAAAVGRRCGHGERSPRRGVRRQWFGSVRGHGPALGPRLRRPVGGDATVPPVPDAPRRRAAARPRRRAGVPLRRSGLVPLGVVPTARGPVGDTRDPAPVRWIHPLSGEAPPELVGGKAHGLIVLRRLGLSVPPGFVVGTAAGRAFHRYGRLPDGLGDELAAAVAELETATGRRLGGPER